MTEITQQIESKFARKVKDEIRTTEKTILKTLSVLSQNSLLHGETTSISITIALVERDDTADQFLSRGLESVQENIASETILADSHFKVHGNDMFTEKVFATTFRPRFQAPSVSLQSRRNLALKTLPSFCQKNYVNHEIFVLNDVKKLDFLRRAVFLV